MDDRKHHFILEMQNYYEELFANRAIHYISTAIAVQLERGKDEYDLEPVYGVMFMSSNFNHMGKRLIHDVRYIEKSSGEIFSDLTRMIFISLPQVKKDWDECDTEVERLIYLVKNMDKLDKESKPYKSGEYSDIFDASERMAMEPDEAYAYEKSYADMDYFRRNLERVSRRVRKEGREEGIKEGQEKRDKEIAMNMLKSGLNPELISHVTGLSLDKIQNLQ